MNNTNDQIPPSAVEDSETSPRILTTGLQAISSTINPVSDHGLNICILHGAIYEGVDKSALDKEAALRRTCSMYKMIVMPVVEELRCAEQVKS